MKTTNYEKKDWILFISVLNQELRFLKKSNADFCREYKKRYYKGDIAHQLTIRSVERYLKLSEVKDDKTIKATPTKKKFIKSALEILQSFSGEELDYITLNTLMSYYETAHNKGLIKTAPVLDKDDLEVYQKQVREPALKEVASLKEKSEKWPEFQGNTLIKDIYVDDRTEIIKNILCEKFEKEKTQRILVFYNLYKSFSTPIKMFWGEYIDYLLELLELNLETSEYEEYFENSNDDYMEYLYKLSSESMGVNDLTIHDLTNDFKNLLLLKEDDFEETDIFGSDKMKLEHLTKDLKKLNGLDLYTAYGMYLIWRTDDKQKRNILVDVALQYCLLVQHQKQ